jgi:3-hydroxyisobutyrate dehydrogenase
MVDAPQQETVAFLGIGTMGHGMAFSALRAGLPTVVWNRSASSAEELGRVGAQVAESAAEHQRVERLW